MRRTPWGGPALLFLILFPQLSSCTASVSYPTFADYPGFAEYFQGHCSAGEGELPSAREKLLLARYRPRFFLPPGGAVPIDFYRDYLPCTDMRSWPEGSLVSGNVSHGLLRSHHRGRAAYLDFDPACYSARPASGSVAYGRVYREKVTFPLEGKGGEEQRLTFLKYNILFPVSGLAADLPLLHRLFLALPGLDPADWHELDNFAAVHVVLDEDERPFAVLLAQHNHHRTYLIGRDVRLPRDDRIPFDVAERSNELYLSSSSPEPQRHRVVRWSLHMEYLLGGGNRPFFRALDVTHGPGAGGTEVDYELEFLSSCDPLYRSEMLLGEPRPYLGRYIGRDGPPGSDYYTIPPLMPLGTLLNFSYLQDGDEEDIAVVREAIDPKEGTMDVARIARHGGRSLLSDWRRLGERPEPREPPPGP